MSTLAMLSFFLGVSSSHHPDIFRVLGAFTIFECCWIIMWSVLLEHDIGLVCLLP